ncbi:hypothetical protein BMF94_2092 [Rhodotorula taiwanensis]|uniref:pH-response regulator protein palC n=1 Tax=Rhodotorula taiwanensis TaxID=741276 RepID=A0A2S5BDH3_9BASI|nr:hypothetical protein BMF94_2092 [Rhodotorula taiwanensis]
MLLPPPIPGSVALHQLLVDPSTSFHTRNLTDANAARGTVRTALKHTTKNANSGQADWTGAARALQEYLGHLVAILACVEADDLVLRTDPVFFQWRGSLSSSPLRKGSQRVALPSLHAELTGTLLAYALCLANQASSLVASLGSYEISASVSSAAIGVHDETINSAADTLCRASGVLMHLAETVVPRWEAAVGTEALRQRPVEMTREVTTALAKMCLADANLLAIRRLLSRSLSVAHSTTTPGPPLPPGHPSPSLLAKLHLHVYTLYDEARTLVKTVSSSTASGPRSNLTGAASSSGEIVLPLRRYLSDGRTLALALSYKWLGVDAGERASPPATGDALGYLALAAQELDALGDKDKGLKKLKGFGKGREAGKGRKGKVQEERESTEAFRSAYEKVNDTVHFQPIPPAPTLQSRLPSGRAALAPKAFSLPPPAFRPSLGTGARPPPPHKIPPPLPPPVGLDGMGGGAGGDDSSDDDDDEAGADDATQVGDYFGAGQYF